MFVEGQLIEINGPQKGFYAKKGYEYEKGKPLYVKAEDLTPESAKEILVQCDYCGAQCYTTYRSYYRGTRMGTVHKCACKSCLSKKVKECNLVNYGVEWTANLSSVREKYEQTCLERYGVKNVNQTELVKQKKIDKSLERYGTINVFQSEEVKQKSKQTITEKYGVDNIMDVESIRSKRQRSLKYVNGRPVSSEQQRLAKLFNGELNKPVGKYRLDIVVDGDIAVEYDGPGHGLEVRIGRVAPEQYALNENERINFILENGYKIIRFIHGTSNKITDEKYLEILETAKQYLEYEKYIIYDFDNEEFLLNSSCMM